jgi:hypothetical protein
MITRRSFLAALCALPFVGKFVRTQEWIPDPNIAIHTVDPYPTMQDRPGHSVYVCPFGLPTLRGPECPCKHHTIHRAYLKGNITGLRFSASDWL